MCIVAHGDDNVDNILCTVDLLGTGRGAMRVRPRTSKQFEPLNESESKMTENDNKATCDNQK